MNCRIGIRAPCARQASEGVYLVDTNVLSAGAPTKPRPAIELVNWMDRNSAFLYISVITIAEVEDGISKARREGASSKARQLDQWLDALLHLYTARTLPLDVPVARQVGSLADLARARGHAPGFADLAIAATARCHDYTILTRNLRHFRMLDVPAHDPFESLPVNGV